jgi:hypothetical protein
VLGSVAQPLIVNPVPRLSADWFSEGGRDMATVVATQANIVGQLAGNLLPPVLVTDAASLGLLGLVNTVLCAAVFALTVLFVRDRPDFPPSAAAKGQWEARERQEAEAEAEFAELAEAGDLGGPTAFSSPALRTIWRDTSTLFKSRDFNLLNFGFSNATGIGWTLLTVEAQLLTPCGYDDAVAGDSGAALLALGVVTAVAAAPIMARTRAYCALQKIVMVFCLAATVFVLAVNRPGRPALVVGAWLLLGAGLQPLLPLTLEHAAEMTYPVPADVSSAVLQTGANVIATVQTFAITPLLGMGGAADCSSVVNPASALVLAFMAVGCLATLPVRKVLGRSEGGG